MAPPPLPLFPSAPSIGFTENGKMNTAIAAAIADVAKANGGKVPTWRLAVIDLTGSSPLPWGGHTPHAMDFTASEAKVIALFAAFALRDMVRRFDGRRAIAAFLASLLGRKPPRPVKLFDDIRARMDPAILAAGDGRLSAASAQERLPKYDAIFTQPPGGLVDFTGAFIAELRAMIVPSSNDGAGTVIRGVGYSYISGAMQALGLFKAGKGPWLAGDYVGKASYVRIDSENDKAVAQAGTALSMAKLMAIIDKQAVPLEGDSYTHMIGLLKDAVDGPDQPWLTRDTRDAAVRIPKSAVTHVKLGRGPLKRSGWFTQCEVFRLKGLLKPASAYAVAFHNVDQDGDKAMPAMNDVARVLRRAIADYET